MLNPVSTRGGGVFPSIYFSTLTDKLGRLKDKQTNKGTETSLEYLTWRYNKDQVFSNKSISLKLCNAVWRNILEYDANDSGVEYSGMQYLLLQVCVDVETSNDTISR